MGGVMVVVVVSVWAGFELDIVVAWAVVVALVVVAGGELFNVACGVGCWVVDCIERM